MTNILLGLAVCGVALGGCSFTGKGSKTVTFVEDTVSVLRNPCMGWGLYDDASGEVQHADEYWAAQDKAAKEYASFFYVRWRWSDMEPEEGKYAWIYDENYKKLIQGALDRGLKLCFRVYNNSQDNLRQSTPDYVRKAGAEGFMATGGTNGTPLWTPYPDDPVFLEKLEKFVKAFAAEYDDAAVVNFVDAYNIGFWGECHSIRLKNPGQKQLEEVLDKISTIYSSNFKNVLLALPFGSQVGFEAEKRIAIDPKGYCMRRDGLGSMWFSDSEMEIAKNMYGKTLLIGESCWWQSCSDSVRPYATDRRYKLNNWRDVYVLTSEQALKHHFNTLDLREIPETTGWTTRAEDRVKLFAVKGGYRLHPTSVTFPQQITLGDSVEIAHSWVNTATGYLPNNVRNWRFKYKPAFALLNEKGEVVKVFVDTAAEPSLWLYNKECEYSFKFLADGEIAPGTYQWGVAVVNTENGNKPEIKLAVRQPDDRVQGWTVLGKVAVK